MKILELSDKPMLDRFDSQEGAKKLRVLKEKLLRIARRVGLHAIFMFVGILLAAFLTDSSPFVTVSAEESNGALIATIMTYLGLLVMFPFRTDLSASIYGIIAALVCMLFTPYWPLGISFGAIVTFIVTTRQHKMPSFGSLFALLLLGLCLANTSLLTRIGSGFYLSLGGLTLLGVVKPRLFDRVHSWFNNWRGKRAAAKQQAQLPADKQQAVQSLVVHQSALAEIMQLTAQIPDEMAMPVGLIEEKAQAIMQCMLNDPRDVALGNRFLNRYLPMIKDSLDGFIRIDKLNASSAQYEQARVQTRDGLINMQQAFGEMHQRLLSNDVDDLVANLNVMDKLIRSDGYRK